jgi:hypothetical protein
LATTATTTTTSTDSLSDRARYSAINNLFCTTAGDPSSIERAAKLYRNAACECGWCGFLRVPVMIQGVRWEGLVERLQ